MRFSGFVISMVIIAGLLYLGSLLLPSKITISKSILIKAPEIRVEREIRDFKNWKHWYPAFKNENVSVIENPAKPGMIQSVSLKDNNGKLLTLNLVASKPDTVTIEVKNVSSTKVNYQFLMARHKDGQTQLTWNVNTLVPWYSVEKVKGIFLDKISGPQYEAALMNLKKAAEK